MSTIKNILDLDAYLQELLDLVSFKDIDTINGIQVSREANLSIKKIAYAVDSTLEIIVKAIEQRADLLIVHHGLFWGRAIPLVDTHYQKVRELLNSNLALYAIHLPLDAHAIFGNNVQLAKKLELTQIKPFGNYNGKLIGVRGQLNRALSLEQIRDKLYEDNNYFANSALEIVKTGDYKAPRALGICGNLKSEISDLAIISGGATKEIDQAFEEGLDLYITGDANHTAWLRARELGINTIFAGHYYTEIWGLLALGSHLYKNFGIQGVFIDSPSGL